MKRSEALRILRQTKTNYNTIAKEWDISRSRPSEVKIKYLKAIKPGFRVLDIGCGNGLALSEVIRRGASGYVGIDVSDRLIKIAEKKHANEVRSKKVKFICADFLSWRLPAKKFDFAFSFAVLHHIPSDDLRQKFIKKIYQALKPGGRAVLLNWNLPNAWTASRFKISEQLANKSVQMDEGDVFVPWRATEGKTISRYLHIFTDKDLKRMAVKAGFKKSSVRYENRAGKKKTKSTGEEQVLILTK